MANAPASRSEAPMTTTTMRACLAAGLMLAFGCASGPRGKLPSQGAAGLAYPSDVRAFVQQTFIHGVPYEAASKFKPSDVPILLALLADPAAEAQWANVVSTLGMIGDAQAVGPLIAFVASGQGQLSPVQYTAKTSAVMALGYI